jgi:hypothetical protein
LGAGAVSIHDRNSTWQQPLRGNFSLLLQTSFDGQTIPSIQQTGTVPGDANSLFFMSSSPFLTLAVSFDRQQVRPSLISGTGDPYYLWGADISAYAGQTGELRFSGDGMLDFITFSPQVIPEPGGLPLLIVAGGLAFLTRRRDQGSC